jgi:hypothetical protein
MSEISLADLPSPQVLARARKIKLGVCLISGTGADGPGSAGVSEMKVLVFSK